MLEIDYIPQFDGMFCHLLHYSYSYNFHILSWNFFFNEQQVRIAAIQCLTSISKYPTFTILPFAQDVQIGLTPALDDKKRLVRNATVEARNQWFIVGSPK